MEWVVHVHVHVVVVAWSIYHRMHVSGWNESRHRCLATIPLPSNKTHTMHVHECIIKENKKGKKLKCVAYIRM